MGRGLLVAMGVFLLSSWPLASGSKAQTAQPVTISLISAPFGTGSYVLSAALEDISKKHHPWLRITHSESPGFVFNVKKLEKEPALKKSMIIGSGLAVDWMAQNGLAPFDKKYPPVKLLANYNLGSYWLATLNPGIKTGKDLVGKKVALGRATQINWAIQPEWVIRHGWEIRDKVEVQFVGPKEAMTALLDGLVDAAIVGGYFDPMTMKFSLSPQTVELLASGRPVYHIPWGEEAVKKTIAKGMPIIPGTIPPGAIEGLKEPLSVLMDTIAWCADPEFPEELAYEVTKLIIQNISRFGEYGELGKLMSPRGLVYGWPKEKIHPGALRAYKEAKILE